ncbi:alpha/beta hydrolase [Terrimonas sp.]|uniref:alpha/beta fold hydrolase n=1 Tax=Terrimonas sp. TaxID=1914338 RepID=UPI000D50AE95|nr:alpha/beta hydrolase [Terrimonas sp.]PVD52394.1 alpha/beta hydrolase [Terrimonas sp.]
MKIISYYVARQHIIMLILSISVISGGNKNTVAGIQKSNSKMIKNTPPFAFDSIKQVKAGELNIGYVSVGPPNGEPVILLHGWPYDIHSYTASAIILAQKGYHVYVPYLRGFGTTSFLSSGTARNGQQVVFALDIIAFMDALNIQRAVIGGFDWGARTANIIAALWPQRCKALVSVSGYLIGSQRMNRAPLEPNNELSWWYQFYFATDRGEKGYSQYTQEFARLIWQTASPRWRFSDSTFAQSAAAFDNPDHVAVVINNYRWRLGLVKGEKQYDSLEAQLALAPVIKVPAVSLEGDANGAPHPEPSAYANKFVSKYVHHTIHGGIGHNLPQEDPLAFANAVIEASNMAQ